MKKIVTTLVGFLLLTPLFAVPIQSSFTKDQQADIEKIVHQYLVKNPQVLVEVSSALQKQQRDEQQKVMTETVRTQADRFLRHPHTPVAGNAKGSVTMIAFLDYNCPYCRQLAQSMVKLMRQNKDLRLVFKEWPIHGAPAIFAAKAALAANLQGKYLEMHELMMGSSERMTQQKVLSIAKSLGLDMKRLKKDMAASWVQQELDQNKQLAAALKIPGTPAAIIAKTDLKNNGQGDIEVTAGMVPAEVLSQMIAKVKKNG